MNLLAFETSSQWISVALSCAGEIREREAQLPNGGSEVLLPWVDALLAEAGLAMSQIDGFAFGAGPGGFTGLRLASGVVQGLAYGLDRPVVPVSTLAAVALDAGVQGDVWALLDARMSEVYAARFCVDGEQVRERAAPMCLAPAAALIAVLPALTCALHGESAPVASGASAIAVSPTLTSTLNSELTSPLTWAGDALTRYPEVFGAHSGVRLCPDARPRAGAVARLALPMLARGEGVSAHEAQPHYVRDKVALTTAERLARGGVR
jgi:tRNA threonylcarbamoyladenosine biosynthesis protein TsaB